MTTSERLSLSFSEGDVHKKSVEHMRSIAVEHELVLSSPNVLPMHREELERERRINLRQLELAKAALAIAQSEEAVA